MMQHPGAVLPYVSTSVPMSYYGRYDWENLKWGWVIWYDDCEIPPPSLHLRKGPYKDFRMIYPIYYKGEGDNTDRVLKWRFMAFSYVLVGMC